MDNITAFIENKLKLKVKKNKSTVERPWKRARKRYKNLKKLGLTHFQAIKFSNTRKGY